MTHPYIHPYTHPYTHSRRYICLTIPEGQFIDNTGEIVYEQLYAQVVHEINDLKASFWFNNDQVARIQELNLNCLEFWGQVSRQSDLLQGDSLTSSLSPMGVCWGECQVESRGGCSSNIHPSAFWELLGVPSKWGESFVQSTMGSEEPMCIFAKRTKKTVRSVRCRLCPRTLPISAAAAADYRHAR